MRVAKDAENFRTQDKCEATTTVQLVFQHDF